MKIERVVFTMLAIATAGIFCILLNMTGYSDAGGLILLGTGVVALSFVLQESLSPFTRGIEINLATRSLFALAAILVGLYNL